MPDKNTTSSSPSLNTFYYSEKQEVSSVNSFFHFYERASSTKHKFVRKDFNELLQKKEDRIHFLSGTTSPPSPPTKLLCQRRPSTLKSACSIAWNLETPPPAGITKPPPVNIKSPKSSYFKTLNSSCNSSSTNLHQEEYVHRSLLSTSQSEFRLNTAKPIMQLEGKKLLSIPTTKTYAIDQRKE